jgi:DNA-binding NarL/FixJ family response regulator
MENQARKEDTASAPQRKAEPTAHTEKSPHQPCAAITPREKTVLKLLAQGKRNQEISEALGITERTVKFHVSSLFCKLKAKNRTELVLLALQRDLVDS